MNADCGMADFTICPNYETISFEYISNIYNSIIVLFDGLWSMDLF